MMEGMERVRRFLVIASQDQRLSTMHICVYIVLCALQSASIDVHFCISRREVMRLCKMRGIATYHKCMRQLHEFGYILYTPSYHPVMGSTVRLNDFEMLIK